MELKIEASTEKLAQIAERLSQKKSDDNQSPFVSPQVAGQFLTILIQSINQINQNLSNEEAKLCAQFVGCAEKFYTQLEQLTDDFEKAKGKPENKLNNRKYSFNSRYYYLKQTTLRELDQLASRTNKKDYLGLCFLFAFGIGLTSALGAELLMVVVIAALSVGGIAMGPAVGPILLAGIAAMAFLSGMMTAGLDLTFFDTSIAGSALNSCFSINTFGFLKEPVKKFVQHTDIIGATIKQDSEELRSLPTNHM